MHNLHYGFHTQFTFFFFTQKQNPAKLQEKGQTKEEEEQVTYSLNSKEHTKTKQIPTWVPTEKLVIFLTGDTSVQQMEQILASRKEEQDPEIVVKVNRKKRVMLEEKQKHNKKPELFSSLCLWKS